MRGKGWEAAGKAGGRATRCVLPMWQRRLRPMMMFMHTLLSQPFTTAQSEAVVRAGSRRFLGRTRRVRFAI